MFFLKRCVYLPIINNNDLNYPKMAKYVYGT